ncbi:hypothetical protein D3C83_15750 [compost metagenome]
MSASADHFADEGAVYRRPIDGGGALAAVAGLPARIGGIADTGCIAASGAVAALADRDGSLYVSTDGGGAWPRRAGGLPSPSSVLIL